MNVPINLPPHGQIACRKCFSSNQNVESIDKWQVVNDPGAWGSTQPEILVLGFSKGFTQANAYRTGAFEAIPFKDMRTRLTASLQLLGLLGQNEAIDQMMVASERQFAFGSLVRCSLSRLNDRSGVRECTGQIMPKAFSEPIKSVVRRCAETFLKELPPSLRLIVLLGTTNSYMKGCRELVRSLHSSDFESINDVAYRTNSVIWVHIAHPSGLNGHHPVWMAGDPSTSSGLKMRQALQAIALAGCKSLAN